MPVHPSMTSPRGAAESPELEREVSKLRREMEMLRRRLPDGAQAHSANSRLPLMLAALALLTSIIALFRH